MPIVVSDSLRVGFGLWNAPIVAVSLELALMAAGVWLYCATTRARDRIGSIGLWALVIFLLIVYIGNLLGPAPPSATAVAWSAQAMWLIVAWGYWWIVIVLRSARGANISGGVWLKRIRVE